MRGHKTEKKAINSIKRVLSFIENVIQALFDVQAERAIKWLGLAWMIGLFLAGALLWAKIFNFGNIPFNYLDWAEVSAARLAFVRNAVMTGQLPLQMPDSSALRNVTDRFMALPDVILSPQMLLMPFMSVGQWVALDNIFLYLLGSWGLLWFRRKYNLSLMAFTVLFLLFNFNGHIVAHFGVGHANWGGYFLFSWLAVLTVKLLEGDHSWRWVTLFSLLAFFILLQGSFHQFVWMLIFLGLVGIVCWKHFTTALKALVCTCLLSLVRLLPPSLELGKFDNGFITGYTTLGHLLWAMVMPVSPADVFNISIPFSTARWWELDLYIGVVGAAFLLFFGLFRWIKNRSKGALFPELLLPLFGMVFLSIGDVYNLVMRTNIPLIDGERVSSRIISLPFVFFLIFAAVEFQRWLDASGRQAIVLRIAQLGMLGILINDLWLHIKLWQPTNVVLNSTKESVDLSIKVVANHPDAPYFTILIIGASVSLVTLIFILLMTWRERKSKSAFQSSSAL